MMTLELIRDIFGWCTLIHIVLLFLWGIGLLLFRDFIYRVHSSFLQMSRQEFDKIHYAGIAFYKILIFVFGLVPYLAMRIVG